MGGEINTRIVDIKLRLEEADSGPWHFHGNHIDNSLGNTIIQDVNWRDFYKLNCFNMQLVAHAPTDIEYLISEVERLTAENTELRAELHTLQAK